MPEIQFHATCFVYQNLVHLDIALAQVDLGQFDLLLQLGVSLGDVVESEDRDTEATEEVAAENNERVEREL
jgi:hypothetical protein